MMLLLNSYGGRSWSARCKALVHEMLGATSLSDFSTRRPRCGMLAGDLLQSAWPWRRC